MTTANEKWRNEITIFKSTHKRKQNIIGHATYLIAQLLSPPIWRSFLVSVTFPWWRNAGRSQSHPGLFLKHSVLLQKLVFLKHKPEPHEQPSTLKCKGTICAESQKLSFLPVVKATGLWEGRAVPRAHEHQIPCAAVTPALTSTSGSSINALIAGVLACDCSHFVSSHWVWNQWRSWPK